MVVEVMGGLDRPGSITNRSRTDYLDTPAWEGRQKGLRKKWLEDLETDLSQGPMKGIISRIKV